MNSKPKLKLNKKAMEISPGVLELSGVIKLPGNINLKEVHRKYIESKYSK
jgi:hypothetical protein